MRDFELLRKIMLKLNEENSYEVEGYAENVVKHHLNLLSQSNMICCSADNDKISFELTWEGCEFAELAKSDKNWKLAMDYKRGVVICSMEDMTEQMKINAMHSRK